MNTIVLLITLIVATQSCAAIEDCKRFASDAEKGLMAGAGNTIKNDEIAYNDKKTTTLVSNLDDLQQKDEEQIISAVAKMQIADLSIESKSEQDRGRDFCSNFLVDFKRGQFEFVKPIVTADNLNDRKLQKYLQKCRNLSLNKTVYWLPHIWRYLQETKTPKDEWEDSGTKVYATHYFKLYRVNFDGNKKNGDELVFSGECDGGHVKIINLEQCKELDEIQVSPTIEYDMIKWIENPLDTNDTPPCDATKLTGSKHGILKYKNKFYLYDISHTDSVFYLHQFKKHSKCVFITR